MRATRAEGQTANQHLIQKLRPTTYVSGVATLKILAGLWLYFILSGLRLSFLRSGYGLVPTIGSLAGLCLFV